MDVTFYTPEIIAQNLEGFGVRIIEYKSKIMRTQRKCLQNNDANDIM